MGTAQNFEIIPTDYIETLDNSAFTSFLHSIAREKNGKKSKFVSVTLPIAGIDPLAALELYPDSSEKFYWDHPENSISISAAGNMAELKATGSSRFSEISEKSAEIKKKIAAYTAISHSMAGPLFLGGYSFTDHNIGKLWNRFGASRFVLPEWMLIRSGNLHLLTLIFEREGREVHELYQEIIEKITHFIRLAGDLSPGENETVQHDDILCTLQQPEDKQRWLNNVEKARDLIIQKKFEKIVIARSIEVESRHRLQPTLMSHKLRQQFPGCYNFLIQVDEDTSFIGATPERLASFKNGMLLTEGLAGSISRGKSALEDAALANSLMKSDKDRSEHQYVVHAIDSSLQPFSYRVEHPKQPRVKKLQNVQHLFTPISASIKDGVQIHELIEKLHPTPAVGGFPKVQSTRHIQQIEQIERGWYSAPIGWFNLNGCGEFAVAIRSALLHKNRAWLYAGCGIVEDSDPETEWNETLIKFRPMLDALNHSRFNHE